MGYHLNGRVEREIVALAKKHGVRKVILFVSRARGDNWERSDIDLAVSGGNIAEFSDEADEKIWTLLLIDVVNLDRGISDELRKEIERDGVLLYEEVR